MRSSRTVEIIAHRGASAERRENSLAAFDRALALGCDAIELDVQLSRDEVPVVYHDRTLLAAGGGRRRVHRLSFDELRRLGARRNERIPSLEQVLERYGRTTRLLVEIKLRGWPDTDGRHERLTRNVVELLRRQRLTRRVRLLCFEPRLLQLAGELAPELRRVLNLRPPRRAGKRLLALLDSLHAVSADVRRLTPAFGAALREADCPLLVFTCNTPGAIARARAAGAAGIMSDRPGWLRERIDALESS